MTKSLIVAGGKAECEVVDFEGKAQSLYCVALWQQMEDVAQQYGWTVKHMSTYLVNGHALKGQAKAVLLPAKRTGDTVLNSKAPAATDIVPSLFRYYQLKFKYIILLGKPVKGAVVNAWMAEVMFSKCMCPHEGLLMYPL